MKGCPFSKDYVIFEAIKLYSGGLRSEKVGLKHGKICTYGINFTNKSIIFLVYICAFVNLYLILLNQV